VGDDLAPTVHEVAGSGMGVQVAQVVEPVGADDLARPVGTDAELVRQRAARPARAEHQRGAAGAGEVVGRQEVLERQPDGHRVLRGTGQAGAALGDRGDLAERAGEVVQLVERSAAAA